MLADGIDLMFKLFVTGAILAFIACGAVGGWLVWYFVK